MLVFRGAVVGGFSAHLAAYEEYILETRRICAGASMCGCSERAAFRRKFFPSWGEEMINE